MSDLSTRWYESLEEEIKQIVTERWIEAEETKNRGRHEVGATLLHYQNEGIINPYARDGSGLDATIKRLSKTFGVSPREVYYCYEFAQTVPDFDAYMANKPRDLRWGTIKKELPSSAQHAGKRPKKWIQELHNIISSHGEQVPTTTLLDFISRYEDD